MGISDEMIDRLGRGVCVSGLGDAATEMYVDVIIV